MKIVKEKTLNQIVTRIINNQFKYYNQLPCNSSVINKIISCTNFDNNNKKTIGLKDNYKEIILNYIEENFKEHKKVKI